MLLRRFMDRTRTNPVFYPDRLRLLLEGQPERLRRAFEEPRSVDLLTWNVFASLDTDRDRDFVAQLLAPFGGSELGTPGSLRLWTGRTREPLLLPSSGYRRHLEQILDGKEPPPEFLEPIEVPVRIETPQALVLIETTLDRHPRGNGGRDRIVELIDAGATQARRVQKALAVAVMYRSGSPEAASLSHRLVQLRDPERLRHELPWLPDGVEVRLREVSWQWLLGTWEGQRRHFQLFGQPVRRFLNDCAELGLR